METCCPSALSHCPAQRVSSLLVEYTLLAIAASLCCYQQQQQQQQLPLPHDCLWSTNSRPKIRALGQHFWILWHWPVSHPTVQYHFIMLSTSFSLANCCYFCFSNVNKCKGTWQSLFGQPCTTSNPIASFSWVISWTKAARAPTKSTNNTKLDLIAFSI